jgi:hypothetical protein
MMEIVLNNKRKEGVDGAAQAAKAFTKKSEIITGRDSKQNARGKKNETNKNGPEEMLKWFLCESTRYIESLDAFAN